MAAEAVGVKRSSPRVSAISAAAAGFVLAGTQDAGPAPASATDRVAVLTIDAAPNVSISLDLLRARGRLAVSEGDGVAYFGVPDIDSVAIHLGGGANHVTLGLVKWRPSPFSLPVSPELVAD